VYNCITMKNAIDLLVYVETNMDSECEHNAEISIIVLQDGDEKNEIVVRVDLATTIDEDNEGNEFLSYEINELKNYIAQAVQSACKAENITGFNSCEVLLNNKIIDLRFAL